jgi:hypothetical protein
MRRVYQLLITLFFLGLSCNVDVVERLWPGNVNFQVTESSVEYESQGTYFDFGTSSGSATFTIENTTSAPFTIFSIGVLDSGNGFAVSNLSAPIPAEIKGFESLTFDVDYTDNSTKRDTQILIGTNASAPFRLGVAGGGSTLNLSYSNSEIVDYRLTANAYELGYQTGNQSDTVTFTNNEKFAIDFTGLDVTGLTQFAATDASTGVLAPGASATFDIDYTHVGGSAIYSEELIIETDGGTGRTASLFLNASTVPEPSDSPTPPVLWLDTNRITSVTDVSGADKVTFWSDRSGNNWYAEAESSEGPVYADSVLGVNGQPLLDFSQGNHVM